jgi:hypothetical protein
MKFRHAADCAGALIIAADTIGVLSSTSVFAADAPTRTVKLRNGAVVPAVGQGSWHLGQGRHPAALEEEALRTGISLGMTLIDTSGNYGNGRSEELISTCLPVSVTAYSWFPKWRPTKCLGTRWRVLAIAGSAAAPNLRVSSIGS